MYVSELVQNNPQQKKGETHKCSCEFLQTMVITIIIIKINLLVIIAFIFVWDGS